MDDHIISMRDNIYYMDPARHNSNLWESAISDVEPTGEIYDQETDTTFKGEPNWLQIVGIYKQAEAEAPQIYDWEAEPDFASEPVEEVSKPSLRARAKNLMSKAAKALDEMTIDALSIAQTAGNKVGTTEVFRAKGKNKLRRRAVTGAVIGALAIGAVASLEVNDSPSVIPRENGAALVQAPTAKAYYQPRANIEKKAPTITLNDNENPWTISEAELRASGADNPSVPEITEYDRRLLKLNHITLEESYSLKTGTKLKLPKVI